MNTTATFLHGKLYRVRQYNDPKMLALGYDINLLNPIGKSNFAYVQVHIPGLGSDGTDNTITLPRADIQHLYDLQVIDQYSKEEKMNWLVQDGKYIRPLWGVGGWRNAESIDWGITLFTNQLVLVDQIQTMRVKVPNTGAMADMQMGRLVTFGKNDWNKTYSTQPWLIPHVTAVNGTQNNHNEFPRGELFLPLFSPMEFTLKPTPSNDAFRREYWAYMDTLTKS